MEGQTPYIAWPNFN